MSNQDEAKARLEVATLYEEMGQTAKAVRYLVAAAEIYRDRGDDARMREIYQRVLAHEPNNAQALRDLGANQQAAIEAQQMPGAPAAPPPSAPAAPAAPASRFTTGGAPAPPPPPAAEAPAAPRPAGQAVRPPVIVPTPWLSREPKFVQLVRAQVTNPPDRQSFPFNPLPHVDPQALFQKAKAREAREEEESKKKNPTTRIDSAFGQREGGFTVGSGFLQQAQVGGGTTSKFAGTSASGGGGASNEGGSRFSRGGDAIAGGNRDLAEMIRQRIQQKNS